MVKKEVKTSGTAYVLPWLFVSSFWHQKKYSRTDTVREYFRNG